MFLELVEEMRVCAFVLHSLLEIELLVWINLNLELVNQLLKLIFTLLCHYCLLVSFQGIRNFGLLLFFLLLDILHITLQIGKVVIIFLRILFEISLQHR